MDRGAAFFRVRALAVCGLLPGPGKNHRPSERFDAISQFVERSGARRDQLSIVLGVAPSAATLALLEGGGGA